ncbi:hypothetical protein AAHN97_16030 [Chitinophaga niabensis]|uniref:hypothetical protein n=1 Tax=Chitinophaga niabensis TaxID=536979 RepID=UPI0031B9B307
MLEKIKEKAEANGIKSKIMTRKIESILNAPRERTDLIIQMPYERDNKNIILNSEHQNLTEILDSNFEKFKFLKGLEAIYSNELGIIECQIESDDSSRISKFLFRRIASYLNTETNGEFRELEGTDEKDSNFRIDFPSNHDKLKIYISESSTEFSFLFGSKSDSYFFRTKLRPFNVIRIEGLNFETHNQAKELLTNIANSAFFQLDLLIEIPFRLSSGRDWQEEFRTKRKLVQKGKILTTPKFQYDQEAISLYWYARTATNTPLLQYLAFYQVLEYYFPLYSAKEARERIRNLLKDPTFDINIEKNIAKILDTVRVSSKSKAIGDERSQLRSTILSCVDLSDLVEHFESNEKVKNFFCDSKKEKSLVTQRISFNRKDHDIRGDIANRIYDLRCRIVHTKEEAEVELLLPFSPDVTLIRYDLDLLEFIARKALIANCKELKFQAKM